MKTIQVIELDHDNKIRLLHKLHKAYLWDDPNYHFFFEPDLIVRTSNWFEISDYLDKRKIDYFLYDYPYSNLCFGYGESRRYRKIQPNLEKLYHLQAEIILNNKSKKLKLFVANRMHHCYLNMLGYEHYDESRYYLNQAYSYMPHQITKFIIKLVYRMTK